MATIELTDFNLNSRKSCFINLNELPSVVDLNVGGKRFTTRLSTLQKYPESMLAVMFSGRHNLDKDKDGNYFIDRNGEHFSYILDFLRDNQTIPVQARCEQVLKEAQYFGIQELVDLLTQHPPLFPSYCLLESIRNKVDNYSLIKEQVKEIAEKGAVYAEKSNIGISCSTVKLITYTSRQYDTGMPHFNRMGSEHRIHCVSFSDVLKVLVGEQYQNVTVSLKDEKTIDFVEYSNTLIFDLQQEGYDISVKSVPIYASKGIPFGPSCIVAVYNGLLYQLQNHTDLIFNWKLIPKTF